MRYFTARLFSVKCSIFDPLITGFLRVILDVILAYEWPVLDYDQFRSRRPGIL